MQGVALAGWLAAAGLGVALIGLVDDIRELSPRLRLALHIALVATLVWNADAVALSQPGWPGSLPDWLVATLWVAAIVWFLNLFNFMDGIDGLATMQCGSFCLAALLFMLGDAGWYAGVLWAGVACSLGFAVFNIAPARIFMGDAGSAFLGLLLGFLVLQLAIAGALPLVASLILLSAFWFDATYTLIVRIATGQRFTQGHRSHLYQRLADRLGHGKTTGVYVVLFLLWQWPLTAWVRTIYVSNSSAGAAEVSADHWADMAGAGLSLNLWWLVVLACAPIAAGCFFLRAGQLDGRKGQSQLASYPQRQQVVANCH